MAIRINPPLFCRRGLQPIIINISLMLVWLSGCAEMVAQTTTAAMAAPESPTAVQRLPTATHPPPAPTAILTPGENGDAPKIFQIGETTFTARSFTVESAAIAAADFNHDGHLDLVNAGEPLLTILLGDGQGGLSVYSRAEGGRQPDDFAPADLDGDGDIDLAIANHDTDYLTLLLGDGQGEFSPAPNSPLKIDVQPHPHAVRTADFDGDGVPDLAVDHRQAGALLILRGLGGGFEQAPGSPIGELRGGKRIVIGDFNGDGVDDAAVSAYFSSEVLVMLGGGASIQTVFLPGVERPWGLTTGDFNGTASMIW